MSPLGKSLAVLHIGVGRKSSLSSQNKWTIEARVTSKGEVRTYTNAKGSGKVLNFDLIDEHCGEIRCVCFNEAADKWDPVIIPGKTYRISRGTLSQANKRFNNLNTDYEIRLDSSSQVQPIEDQGTIPSMNFNLWNLADIENFESGTTVDTMGVVLRVGEQSSITRRDMSTAYRRSISLADQTARIELTLWDRFAQQEGAKINEAAADASKKPIVAIKGARVGSFNGVTLNSTSNCQVVLHPPLKVAADSLTSHAMLCATEQFFLLLRNCRRRSSWSHCSYKQKTQMSKCSLVRLKEEEGAG